jgi:hypothetical protein
MRPVIVAFTLLFVALTACSNAAVSAPRYKFLVSADGIYRVSSSALREAGAMLDKIDLNTLQLYHGDREVAIRVSGNPADFTIEFYGQASHSAYSAKNAYWLRWGVQSGKRMRDLAVASADANLQRNFQDTVRVARPMFYITQAGYDQWFSQTMIAPVTTTITATLVSAVAAPAQLHLNLWSNSESDINPDHHIQVFFNDVRVTDARWDGMGERTIDATIPITAVRAGENRIRLSSPGDTKAIVEVTLLHSAVITYTRQRNAINDMLIFSSGAESVRVDGFSGDAVDLYEVTNADDPQHVSNVALNANALAFRSDASRRWIAVGARASLPVAQIVSMQPSSLRTNDHRADYLIITHPDFVAALQPLVQWREQHGLKVRLVTIDEVYNEFTSGAESPVAIQAFIDWTLKHWQKPAPRFVLLVGKASYDYRNYLNAPNKNLVPTYLVQTPNLGSTASDNWFVADSESQVTPQLAIGRIPAKTPDQVTRVINKIVSYESKSGDWKQRALIVADSKDSEFEWVGDKLADRVPGLQSSKIYLSKYRGDVNATRAEIISKWNAGALMVTYIGHGSINTWAEGPLFSSANVKDLSNGERLPILLTPTCLDGFFYHPQVDSLAEDLLFKDNGGIIAGLVPTGRSFTSAQERLTDGLFAQLFEKSAPTLGEAVMRAKQSMNAQAGDEREVIETFVLLGDPALKFERPK